MNYPFTNPPLPYAYDALEPYIDTLTMHLHHDRHLQILPLANQDTPLPLRLTPLLNIDVWEHAYYLKHYNLRKDYIADWFQVVHWSNANRIYEEFISFL